MCPSSPFNPMDTTSGADTVRNVSSIDPNLSRTNYFDGRLLKASDLIRDQLYLDERLREVGRAMGQGIVQGLEVELDDQGHLRVSPGIAVAPSGRVLELEGETPLRIDLLNRGRIAELNPGFRQYPRGLYAVTLAYAEMGQGSAEAYPRDLQADRGFHFNAFAEGVEITLTPLGVRPPQRNLPDGGRAAELAGRAALARQLVVNPGQPAELPADAVALGLMAVDDSRPLWLDLGLVRRPYRLYSAADKLQMDLHRHYEELLANIVASRDAGLRPGEFPASHYFELLPPFGSVPRASVDPENGRQGFFPPGFEVSVAPVREEDLPAILQQSRNLEPIDLRQDNDVDLMVLIPLTDHQFAWRARQLQHSADEGRAHRALDHLDPLALRLYGETAAPEGGTDAAVWREIMAQSGAPIFVRRPTRVAETQVSAVVMARGYELPDAENGGSDFPPDGESSEEIRIRLETQVSDLEKANAKLQSQLELDPDELLAEAQEQLSQLEAQVLQLQNQLEDHQALAEQLTQLTDERNQLQQTLQEAEARIAELEAPDTLEAQLRARISELEQELELAAARIQELESGEEDGRAVPIEELAKWRSITDDNILQAAAKLVDIIGGDTLRLQWVNDIALIVGSRFDSALWPTLNWLAENKLLQKLREHLVAADTSPIEARVIEVLRELDVPADLIQLWQTGGLTINLDEVQIVSTVDELAKRANLQDENLIAKLSDTMSVSNQPEEDMKNLNFMVALSPSQYTPALWSSMPTLINNAVTGDFVMYLLEARQRGLPLGLAVAASLGQFKLSSTQRGAWAKVDFNG